MQSIQEALRHKRRCLKEGHIVIQKVEPILSIILANDYESIIYIVNRCVEFELRCVRESL